MQKTEKMQRRIKVVKKIWLIIYLLFKQSLNLCKNISIVLFKLSNKLGFKIGKHVVSLD